MKKHTTMKAITKNFKTFQTGYCDLQNIFRYEEPKFYNAGMYGWNCDVYCEGGIAITTGYRNMRGKLIPREIVEKYDKIAQDILKDTFVKTYDEIKERLNENKSNFLNELYNM